VHSESTETTSRADSWLPSDHSSRDGPHLPRCPTCSADAISASFRIAFHEPGPDGHVAWSVAEGPPLPRSTFDRCLECGLRFANERPDADSLHSFYLRQQDPYESEIDHYVEATPKRGEYWA
jgi:hypothetical protein